MIRKFAIGIISLAVFTGCSSMQERIANNSSVDYSNHDERLNMELDEDLRQPNFNPQYTIPAANENGDTGKSLSVAAPRLIMPLLKNTFVEQGSQHAEVNVDRIDDNVSLDQTVWQMVRDYLQAINVSQKSFQQQPQRLVTEWLPISHSSLFDDESEVQESAQFELLFTPKDHKRSGLLKVNLLATKANELDGLEKRAQEAILLNNILQRAAKQERKRNELRREELQTGVALEMAADRNGKSTFIVDAPFDITWVRLVASIRDLGFKVTDYDRSAGKIYAKYEGLEKSFFSRLVGSADNLPIDKTTYHIQLGDLRETTSIIFLNDEDVPMSAQFMSDIQQAIAERMADNQLDI